MISTGKPGNQTLTGCSRFQPNLKIAHHFRAVVSAHCPLTYLTITSRSAALVIAV